MAYGSKYWNQFSSTAGEVFRFDIEIEGYAGASTRVVNAGDPLIFLSDKDSEDFFGEAIGRQVQINLRNINSVQEFYDLAVDGETDVRVVVRLAGNVIYTGFLVPLNFVQDYKRKGTVSLTFTDRLGALANEPFLQSDGENYTGLARLIVIIANILAKTGISADIYSCDNLFSADMDKGAADDPLYQNELRQEFYTNPDGEPTFCIDVLNQLLLTKNLTLRLHPEGWFLFNTAEISAGAVAYRRFNSAGVYQSNGTFDFRQSFNKASDQTNGKQIWQNIRVLPDKQASVEMLYPIGEFQIGYSYQPLENTDVNNDFEADKWIDDSTLKDITPVGLIIARLSGGVGGEFYLRLDGKVASLGSAGYVPFPAQTITQGNGNEIQLSFDFKIRNTSLFSIGSGPTVYMELKLVGASDTYYYVNGVWKDEGKHKFTPTEKNKWIPYELKIEEIPESGSFSVTIFQLFGPSLGWGEDLDIDNFRVQVSDQEDEESRLELYRSVNDNAKLKIAGGTVTLNHLPAPTAETLSALILNDDVDNVWARSGVTEARELVAILLQQRNNMYGAKRQKIRGQFVGIFDPTKIYEDPFTDDVYWYPSVYSYSAKLCQGEVTFVELRNVEEDITVARRSYNRGNEYWFNIEKFNDRDYRSRRDRTNVNIISGGTQRTNNEVVEQSKDIYQFNDVAGPVANPTLQNVAFNNKPVVPIGDKIDTSQVVLLGSTDPEQQLPKATTIAKSFDFEIKTTAVNLDTLILRDSEDLDSDGIPKPKVITPKDLFNAWEVKTKPISADKIVIIDSEDNNELKIGIGLPLTMLRQEGATDGQAIVWNDADGVWEAQTVSGSKWTEVANGIYRNGRVAIGKSTVDTGVNLQVVGKTTFRDTTFDIIRCTHITTASDLGGYTSFNLDVERSGGVLDGQGPALQFITQGNLATGRLGAITGIKRGSLGEIQMYVWNGSAQRTGLILTKNKGLYIGDRSPTDSEVTTEADAIEAKGRIKTGNPTGRTARYVKLGEVVTDTVSLDTTRYYATEIDGVAVKLAIVT